MLRVDGGHVFGSQELSAWATLSALLLVLAVPTVWWASLASKQAARRVMPALAAALVSASLLSALLGHVINTSSLLVLLSFWGLALWARRRPHDWRIHMALGVAALSLALHAWPGIQRVPLSIPFVESVGDFTLQMKYDKVLAGVMVIAAVGGVTFGSRARRDGYLAGWWFAWLCIVMTPVLVLSVASLIGLVKPNSGWAPNWSAASFWLIASNVVFTCVAEEAFFRAWLQGLLSNAMVRRGGHFGAPRMVIVLPVLVSAACFGAAHLGGGIRYAAVVGLAGVGYGFVFAATRRLDAAVLAHGLLNALQFTFFK
jgi:uncharacterized protein